MRNNQILKFGLSLLLPGILVFFPPLEMDLDQGVVLAALVLTVTWWATGIVKKTFASLFLLTTFSFWGGTPLVKVFRFPLSEDFVLILFSFIFTKGIMNSGLTEKLIEPALEKGSKGIHSLLWMVIGLNTLLIFVIPQPFARIIILGTILKEFFQGRKFPRELIGVLMFFTFATAIVVNMMFIRGDIILNNALIAIAGIEITRGLWIQIMTVPTLIFIGLTYVLFYITFKQLLLDYPVAIKTMKSSYQETTLTKKDKRNLWLILVVVLIWILEPFHGIGSPVVIVLGTGMMALFGLVKKRDLGSVDFELLIFITAAFSIGEVMTNSGVAEILFLPLKGLLPEEFGVLYLFVIMVISMAMHMILGSNITTLSVVVPSLMVIGEGVIPTLGLVFIIHVSVSTHYLLPFHNVMLLIGNGKGFFDSGVVTRYGLGLTFIMPLVLLGIYYTWWRIIGLL